MAEGGNPLGRLVRLTQATNLPTKINVAIQPIDKLNDRNGWKIWSGKVKFALQAHRLADLIRADLPRPAETDPKIVDSPKPHEWPDDFFQVIQQTVVGAGHNLSHRIFLESVEVKRSDYGTLTQFIEASKEKTMAAIDAKNSCIPRQAISILFKGLSEDMKTFVEVYLFFWDEAKYKTLKWEDYWSICEAALDRKKASDIWIYKRKQTKAKSNDTTSNTTSNAAAIAQAEDSVANFNISGATIQASSIYQPLGKRWLVDSGAAYAVCKWFNEITDFQRLSADEADTYAYLTSNNERVVPRGKGYTIISLRMDDGSVNCFKIECIWNPDVPCNLFPAERAKVDLNLYHDAKNQCIRDMRTDKIVGYTFTDNGMPYLRLSPTMKCALIAPIISSSLLHARFAHTNAEYLARNKVLYSDDLEVKDPKNVKSCDTCYRGKTKKKVSHIPINQATKPLQRIHVDTQEFSPLGIYGYRYALIIVDDYSRCLFIRLLRKKSDASEALKQIHLHWFNLTGKDIAIMHSDATPDFNKYKEFASPRGTRFEITAPRCPEQNGTLERYGGYVVETAEP
ncbi:integrase catalytic domain-containing protein [Aspergillus affinis]|uniref:integrase catalytic domain-containing protein n=1 Tax=Aspergillus affinis TaxID=1070780 RepID=UPI0022FDE275|nr:uncharacterized protein KD926_001615 [Aspergillus affinis]KAI9036661.1 hypothetical protein KD926_001615 [Aspergillus affinis]